MCVCVCVCVCVPCGGTVLSCPSYVGGGEVIEQPYHKGSLQVQCMFKLTVDCLPV